MKKPTPKRQVLLPALIIALASVTALTAIAQPRPSDAMPPPRNQPPPQSRQTPVVRSRPAPGPQRYSEVRYGNDRFYTHRGIFYRPGPRGYVVVRPPVGIIVPALPIGYARIYVNNNLFFRFNNIYYRPSPGGYIVVDTPSVVISTPAPVVRNTTVIVTTPPPPVSVSTTTTTTTAAAVSNDGDYQSLWIDGTEYYFKNGQFFQKTSDGLVWVEPLMGAVIQKLPADATSVWYQDVEYFDCDSVYFRKTPDGYKVVDAPWTATQS